MRKLYIGLLIAVPTVLCVVILVICLARHNLKTDLGDMTVDYEAQLSEIEQQPDVIEYVEEEPYLFYEDAPSKDNIASVLELSYAEDTQINIISTMLAMQVGDYDLPWLINYNKGYCDAYVMYFDGSERQISIMCYTDNVYVLKDTDESFYTYTHNDFLCDASDNMVEALQYKLKQQDTWNWNMFEACVVYGQVQENFPKLNYDIIDGYVVIENGSTVKVDNGVLTYLQDGATTGTLYAMYPNMSTTPIVNVGVDTSNWFPADTYNIVAVIEALEDEELPVWEDSLVEVFSDREPSMLMSWTYYVEDNVLRVTTIEYDDSYTNGVNEYNLFTLDLETGQVSKFY